MSTVVNTVARSLSSAALMLLIGTAAVHAETPAPPATPPTETPAATAPAAPGDADKAQEVVRTEVVFCIDCSGSMSQSLARAQQAMGSLIREMQAKTPDAPIRVGVIRYGTGSDALEVCPLTGDPNTFAGYLSRLQISGGAEFVGTFIQKAVEGMRWSDDDSVLRHIVMVGNETAFQGPIDYRRAAQVASERGFTVSAVYCPTISDERGAEVARATATTRVITNGVVSRPGVMTRGMLDVENTWILTAYFGGGEVMKLSADPSRPLLRYSPMQVAQLVEEIIPQQQAQMAQADAIFAGLDQTGRIGGFVRRSAGRPGAFRR